MGDKSNEDKKTAKIEPMNVEDGNKGENPKYPKIVFLIIINELCERFSFYGLRTVLFLFFKDFIGLEENTALSIYHAFASFAYFTPIVSSLALKIWNRKLSYSLTIFFCWFISIIAGCTDCRRFHRIVQDYHLSFDRLLFRRGHSDID